jgi:hypothetical protein
MQIKPFPKDHLNEFPWQRGWLWHRFHDYDGCKTEETQMHIECTNKRDELHDVSTCYIIFLKYDPS